MQIVILSAVSGYVKKQSLLIKTVSRIESESEDPIFQIPVAQRPWTSESCSDTNLKMNSSVKGFGLYARQLGPARVFGF